MRSRGILSSFALFFLVLSACGAGEAPDHVSSAGEISLSPPEPSFVSNYSRARYLIENLPNQAVPRSFAVEAERLLAVAREDYPDLASFVNYHQAEIAFQMNDWEKSSVLLSEVIADTTAPSTLRNEARFLQAECSASQGESDSALAEFLELNRSLDGNQRDLKARVLWRRLEIFESNEDRTAAVAVAQTLEEDYASTIYGHRAALYRKRLLNEFPAVMGFAPGSAELEFARAEWLYDHTHYEEGAEAFVTLLERPGLSSTMRVEAVYTAGRCAQREWRYDQARTFMEPLLAAQGLYHTYALYQMGKIAFGEGRYEEAMEYFRRLLQESPLNFLADDALWNLADLERTVGETAEAQELYRRLYFNYPRSEYRALALFMLGRTRLESNDPDHALATFEQIFDHYENTVLAPAARYWMGISREAKGETEDALNEYLRLLVSYSDNDYGFRARDRIAVLRPAFPNEEEFSSRITSACVSLTAGDTESALASALWAYYGWPNSPRHAEAESLLRQINRERSGWSELLVMPYDPDDSALWDRLRAGAWVRNPGEHNRQLNTARTLYDLGAYDESAMILHTIRSGTAHPLAFLYLKSRLHALAGQTHESMIEITRLMTLIPGPVDAELLPEPVARLLYPRFYWAEAVQAGETAGVDPYLLLAIAREESRFNPDVVSSATAIGLCQFIPSTGSAVALQAGLMDYENESLARPEVSLLLCATYIASLRDQWNGSVERALASYNGGPGNVAAWEIRNPDQDAVDFIESILFKESRYYVRRVWTSYENYRRLYED